jgi:hypothetical protein
MDAIYKLLKLNKQMANVAYERLLNLKGLQVKITKPIESERSIFGYEDIVAYEPALSYNTKLLLFGIFQEGSQGMQEFDTFIECFALTKYRDRLPLQTHIEVNFCNRKMTFKVDDHKNLAPSLCEQLFIKNILVPAT